VLGGPFTGPVISDARWIRLIVRPEPDGDAFTLDLLDAPYVGAQHRGQAETLARQSAWVS
jgi:hypothetical protein